MGVIAEHLTVVFEAFGAIGMNISQSFAEKLCISPSSSLMLYFVLAVMLRRLRNGFLQRKIGMQANGGCLMDGNVPSISREGFTTSSKFPSHNATRLNACCVR